MSPVELLVGPLAGPECRRILSRGGLLTARFAAGVPPLLVLGVVVWLWWLTDRFMPGFRPGALFQGGLATIDGMAIVAALLMAPAMLAATLAGDKDRGTLGMLLVSGVSARELVAARLTSRLAAIGAVLLAALPSLAFTAGLAAAPVETVLLLVALPMAVALGGGGLALAASSLARRGRDALMGVYLLDLLLVVVAWYVGAYLPAEVQGWLRPLNPFAGLVPLVWSGQTGPALVTILWWTALGLFGCGVAAWRLGPVYLRQIGGTPRRGPRRRATVAVPERPMHWKERHIEQASGRTGIVGWIGWIVLVLLLTTSLCLASVTLWSTLDPAPPAWVTWANLVLAGWVTFSARPLSWLIQWSVALRAAVGIASERERHTWDTLLTTPLEGRDIVWAKIGGSLYAMRGLLVVAALAWTVALACGHLDWAQYVNLVGGTFVAGAFMAAVGTWASIGATSVARAMTIALAAWLAAMFAIGTMSLVLTAFILWLASMAQFFALGMGWIDSSWGGGFLTWVPFVGIWNTFDVALYALAAVVIAWYLRRGFDQLAGRSSVAPLPRDPWEAEVIHTAWQAHDPQTASQPNSPSL